MLPVQIHTPNLFVSSAQIDVWNKKIMTPMLSRAQISMLLYLVVSFILYTTLKWRSQGLDGPQRLFCLLSKVSNFNRHGQAD